MKNCSNPNKDSLGHHWHAVPLSYDALCCHCSAWWDVREPRGNQKCLDEAIGCLSEAV